jgi:hypothetical protein
MACDLNADHPLAKLSQSGIRHSWGHC